MSASPSVEEGQAFWLVYLCVQPVMSRADRWKLRYAHAHSNSTTMRLRKPMSRKMWTKIQITHAKKPDILIQPKFATAAARPIVASVPMSR